MPIVNGKIVRSKTKTKKVVEDETKVKSKTKKKVLEKEKKNPIQKGYDDLKKDVKADKPKKSEKKAKKKSKEDFIRTGPMAGLQIEQSEYNGNQVVAVRKMYCTKNDPEMKVGKGGFNLPFDADVLDGVIEALQQVRDSM